MDQRWVLNLNSPLILYLLWFDMNGKATEVSCLAYLDRFSSSTKTYFHSTVFTKFKGESIRSFIFNTWFKKRWVDVDISSSLFVPTHLSSFFEDPILKDRFFPCCSHGVTMKGTTLIIIIYTTSKHDCWRIGWKFCRMKLSGSSGMKERWNLDSSLIK